VEDSHLSKLQNKYLTPTLDNLKLLLIHSISNFFGALDIQQNERIFLGE
jgi:hypothetical protein